MLTEVAEDVMLAEDAMLAGSFDAEGAAGTQRKQWSQAEDNLVRQLVQLHGTRSWTVVAQALPGRTGKQCRERWHNHLDHDIRKDAWCARAPKARLRVL
jgi:hypothetical protein